MSQKAFPKRKVEIEQNIAALQVLMQLLTFAQFGALIYTFLRTQWHKRHETAEKFSKLKTRASWLRSRSSKGRSESGSDMEVALTVAGGEIVTAPTNASSDGGDNGDGDDGGSGGDGGGGGGGNGGGGIELQAMSRSASTEMDVANPFRERGRSTPSGADLSNGGGDKSGFELQSMSRRVSTGMDEISV